ncbi:MAG: hypothetical protein IKT47_03450 [Oscillospiraceae bacterium]|nr:hypothetical protein [Oscillospiraceae bacterium]
MAFVKIIAVLMLAAVAMLVFWLLYGIIICPVKPGRGERLEAVLRVKGSAPCLENTLRGLMWLRGSGRVDMAIVVVDEGMDEDTRQTVELLCGEGSGVALISKKI